MTNTISVDTANKMLMLIAPITTDIKKTWQLSVHSFEALQQLFESDADKSEHVAAIARQMNQYTRSICHNLDELEECGCVLESWEQGIVDFPSELEGEEIMLCWKLGEKEVKHHHRRGDTFEHRSLIDQVLEG